MRSKPTVPLLPDDEQRRRWAAMHAEHPDWIVEGSSCFWHDGERYVPEETFRRCLECGHSFSEQELIDLYNQGGRESVKHWRDVDDASRIHMCPCCVADFR